MKIAVLMSSYNGASYIEEQIESILTQQGDFQLDLFVRDDGSTDETKDILQRYADEGKLRWYTGENLKPARSFIDLVSTVSGYDYYAFADQDDHWYPNKVQCGISAIADKIGPAMVFANARLVDRQLVPLGRNVYRKSPNCDFYSVLCGGGILGCTIIFNAQLAELLREYSQPKKLIMHDSYLAILCTLFDGEIVYDPTPYMDYRQHGKNIVGAQWTKWDAIKNRIYRVTKKHTVSIAEMAQSILDQHPCVNNEEKYAFLKKVADYRENLWNASCLAVSGKPRYSSKNMEITMRLAILLRNR